ncbi:MAG: DUF711 family protein [Gammaproteobacteria bacterium]|nr:DUF711 family protein [Gammaproteobacteria bacterium]
MYRRDFLFLLPAAFLVPGESPAARPQPFRIRTITAGVPLELNRWQNQLQQSVAFLRAARSEFQAADYEVQTLRIATQPLPEYRRDWLSTSGLKMISELDDFCEENDVVLSVGPVINTNRYEPGLADWAAELIHATKRISFTVGVASPGAGVHPAAIRAASEVIAAIAQTSPNGEGNFNFAATAHCPPGTPFFPAGWHRGAASFAIGLESPPLLLAAVNSIPENTAADRHIAASMDASLTPVQSLAEDISARTGLAYGGIDASPAPGPDASIGEVIEALAGAPFGNASTLSACADITSALKSLNVKTCGYSGLMLPVLEDKVLARRAAEKRYGISELLLYSSVCGTGLDVVPVAGDSSAESMASVIGDVAALSNKYQKPLSARLFPVPGKATGDAVTFNNPFLTDSVVMRLD